MKEVCSVIEGEKTVFESTDTESFGKAMNAAFAAVYSANTVTIPVNAEEFDVSGLSVTAGEAVYNNGTITWTINDMPFTQHTLTYTATLKEELANRVGTYSYSINNGDATFGNNGAHVGLDLTLSRTVDPEPDDSDDDDGPTYYTLTINYVDEEGGILASETRRVAAGSTYTVTAQSIEGYTADEEVVTGTMPASNTTITVTYTADNALSENPGEEDLTDGDTPLSETPDLGEEEDLTDGDTPLADVPQTGDKLYLWLALSFMSAMGLGWLTVLEKKSKHIA